MNQGNQCFPQLMAENRRQGRWRENERSERNSTRSNNHVACVFRGIISDYIRIFVVFNECWIWIFSLFWYSRKPIKNRMYGDNWETEHKPKQMSSESSFVISLDSFDSDMNNEQHSCFQVSTLKAASIDLIERNCRIGNHSVGSSLRATTFTLHTVFLIHCW